MMTTTAQIVRNAPTIAIAKLVTGKTPSHDDVFDAAVLELAARGVSLEEAVEMSKASTIEVTFKMPEMVTHKSNDELEDKVRWLVSNAIERFLNEGPVFGEDREVLEAVLDAINA